LSRAIRRRLIFDQAQCWCDKLVSGEPKADETAASGLRDGSKKKPNQQFW
jgi:hypothetical protein